MPSNKKNKLMFIVQEFEKRNDRYNINGIDTSRAKYFARKHQGMFEEIPLGNYNISLQGNQNYLIITNKEYLATIERLQICYEFASISSDYEVEFEVDVNTLKNKYNQLVTDVKNLFTYVQKNMMTADALDVFNVLPQLDTDEVWVKTADGWRGLSIGNLESNIQGLLDEMKAKYNKYMADITRIGDGYEKDISHMGNTFKKEMTQIKNDNYAEINGLGTRFKTDIQAMGEMYLGNIAGSFEREVLQGKADIDHHTDEKLEVLDSTTALKVQELENKKVVCIQELNNTTSLKKTELEDYEKELEGELAKYPVMKKEELDQYVANTSLPSIDLHTATKIDSIDDHVLLKKEELNTFEKEKEKELDAYNKTNVGKYDTEIREGLMTYQMFLVNEMDSHAKEVTAPQVDAIVRAGVENARSQVDGEVAKVREEGNTQLQLVSSEGSRQVGLVTTEGDLQIKRIQETSLDGKQDKEDPLLQTTSKNIVGAINELKTKKLDATGGLVSGELDIDTTGDNAIRFLQNHEVKGYIYPTPNGMRITGTDLRTSGITLDNNGDKVVMEKGVTVRDRLKIEDFLEQKEYADIFYSVSDEDQPHKALVLGNVEHLVVGDNGQFYRVFTQKNFDPNSKFNVTGGDIEGNVTIKKDGIKTLKFIDNATNEYGEITCDGGNGTMYIKNKRVNKGITITTEGTTIDAMNLETQSKEVVGAINELKETKLNKTASSLQTSSKNVVDAINEVNNKKLNASGGTVTGSLNVNGGITTTANTALAVQATRGSYTAMFGCSATSGEFVFGGRPNSQSDYQSYIRIAPNKLKYYTSGSTSYDILTSKGGYTMNGSLTVGTNSAKSKLRVVSGSDAVSLAVPNDESNYMTFVKNNASSSVRKGWFGFGSDNTSTMTMRNDISGKQVSISTSVGINTDIKVTDGSISIGTSGKTFQAYHNYGYMCGADSSNTQVYAMYGYNNVLNIGYNNQFPTVRFNANEVVAQSNISCGSITINGWKLTISG